MNSIYWNGSNRRRFGFLLQGLKKSLHRSWKIYTENSWWESSKWLNILNNETVPLSFDHKQPLQRGVHSASFAICFAPFSAPLSPVGYLHPHHVAFANCALVQKLRQCTFWLHFLDFDEQRWANKKWIVVKIIMFTSTQLHSLVCTVLGTGPKGRCPFLRTMKWGWSCSVRVQYCRLLCVNFLAFPENTSTRVFLVK